MPFYYSGNVNPPDKNSGFLFSRRYTSFSSLYEFESVTFTPGTAEGRFGPSLFQARDGLIGLPENPSIDLWKNDINFFNVSDGIQLWTVPRNGLYRITAYGARGGNANTPGRGALMAGDFLLLQGEILNILVGQQGNQSGSSSSKGGGGGTFVWRSNTLELLIAAGGGGGAQASSAGVNASITTAGTTKRGGSGTPGIDGNGTRNGAGWFTNGNTDGTTAGGGIAPLRPLEGGVGGSGHSTTHQGGFGGGGGGGGSPSTTQASGGGGGFSGGAGVGTPVVGGGGGGSYNVGFNQNNIADQYLGNGKLEMEYL
jgi:hypothetical protein